jgi:hypothetical protein
LSYLEVALKISRDPDHPAFHEYHGLCHVSLEGAERNNIRFADEEARYAETWRLDEWGDLVTDKAGDPIWDRFYGSVLITCPDWVRHEIDNPARGTVLESIVLYLAP